MTPAKLALAVVALDACCHLAPREPPRRDLPFEIFQENHLGDEWRLKEVQYSLDGVALKTWRAMGPDDPGSSKYAVFEDKTAPGAAQLTVTIVLLHLGDTDGRGDQVVRFTTREYLSLVPGLRSRHVLRLCPLQGAADPLRAVSSQLETAYYRLDARPVYARGDCLAVQPQPGGGAGT